jgi:hypothetical protein
MFCTRYSCRILITLKFSRQILGKIQISNFVKIRPVGAELFHADRQKDGRIDRQRDGHDEANSRFSQSC